MKKLLLIIFVLSLVSCQDQITQTNFQKPTRMEIDQSKLTGLDKWVIKTTDSIAAKINASQPKYIRQFDSSIVQNNIKTDIKYKAFYDSTGNTITKIISSGANSIQKMKYVFYYFEGVAVIKIDTEIIDNDPFNCSVYFHNGKAIYPNELSEVSVRASEQLARDLLQFFKYR